MNIKFILANVLLLVAMIAMAQYTFEPLFHQPWPHWGFHFIFGWLLIAALVGYVLLESKMRSKPKDFVNTFMLVSGLRMLLSVLVVVILVLKLPGTGKYVSVYYAGGYLAFLTLEVVFLFKRARQIK